MHQNWTCTNLVEGKFNISFEEEIGWVQGLASCWVLTMWFVLWDKSTGFDLILSLIKAFIEHQIWSQRMAANFSSEFNPWSLEEEYNHTLIQSSMGINFLDAKFRGHCRVAPNYSSKWALKEYMLMGTSVLQWGTRDII